MSYTLQTENDINLRSPFKSNEFSNTNETFNLIDQNLKTRYTTQHSDQ